MWPSSAVLFLTAPLDFDRAVLDDYGNFMQVVSGTDAYDIPKGISPTVWVCSPGHPEYVNDDMLGRFPSLHILATASTGTNHIDLDACARRGIRVLSLLDDRAGLETISASAEWTFKLILEGLRLKRPYHELQGRTVGLVGYGRIGRKVWDWCRAFGVEDMFSYDPYVFRHHTPNHLLRALPMTNVLVLCCALTPETTGMVTYDLLKLLPQDAVLVNTARGEVVDEIELYRFMRARPDVRVCVDVVEGEVDGFAEIHRMNIRNNGGYVTDHIAGDTYESRSKAARIILRLLQSAREAGNGAASPVAEVAL